MSDQAITVIVPTYNHETQICAAVESVVRQTVFGDCRVVISDDCSSDRTFELVEPLAGRYSNITLRRNAENLGVMKHYQTLISQIATPFTAILEGDDLWTSERKLEVQRQFLECHPAAGMCFSACVVDYEADAKQVSHPLWNDRRNRIIDVVDLIYDNPVATFSNCFYRTPILKDAILSADSTSGYDWLCTLKIASVCEVGFLGEPSTLYRVHRDGAWSRLSRDQQVKAIRETLGTFRHANPSMRLYIDDAIRIAK